MWSIELLILCIRVQIHDGFHHQCTVYIGDKVPRIEPQSQSTQSASGFRWHLKLNIPTVTIACAVHLQVDLSKCNVSTYQ